MPDIPAMLVVNISDYRKNPFNYDEYGDPLENVYPLFYQTLRSRC
jgi:hypothetical protein